MKKILLMSVCAVLALSACDRKKDDAVEPQAGESSVSVPMVTPENVTQLTGNVRKDAVEGGQTTQAQAPTTPIVGGAMVNTPVASDTPALQNTPAPTVAQATDKAGPAASTCGADQSWVGQNLKSIDLSQITGVIRTFYPDQPVTMDYSDSRLNIIIERGTDKVLEAKCG